MAASSGPNHSGHLDGLHYHQDSSFQDLYTAITTQHARAPDVKIQKLITERFSGAVDAIMEGPLHLEAHKSLYSGTKVKKLETQMRESVVSAVAGRVTDIEKKQRQYLAGSTAAAAPDLSEEKLQMQGWIRDSRQANIHQEVDVMKLAQSKAVVKKRGESIAKLFKELQKLNNNGNASLKQFREKFDEFSKLVNAQPSGKMDPVVAKFIVKINGYFSYCKRLFELKECLKEPYKNYTALWGQDPVSSSSEEKNYIFKLGGLLQEVQGREGDYRDLMVAFPVQSELTRSDMLAVINIETDTKELQAISRNIKQFEGALKNYKEDLSIEPKSEEEVKGKGLKLEKAAGVLRLAVKNYQAALKALVGIDGNDAKNKEEVKRIISELNGQVTVNQADLREAERILKGE